MPLITARHVLRSQQGAVTQQPDHRPNVRVLGDLQHDGCVCYGHLDIHCHQHDWQFTNCPTYFATIAGAFHTLHAGLQQVFYQTSCLAMSLLHRQWNSAAIGDACTATHRALPKVYSTMR